MAKSIRTNIIWFGLVLFHLSVSYMIALTRGFRWVSFLIPGAAWLFFCWCWYRSEVAFANNNGDSPALYDARGKTTYVHMTPEKVKKVVIEHLVNGKVVSEYTIGATVK